MNHTTYLFDFDYTLADSSRGIVLCFQTVLRRHGYTDVSDEAVKRTIGKTLEESFSILTGITDADRLASLRKEYGAEADVHMNANTIFFEDTLSTLEKLKSRGVRLGIISTKYRYRIQSFLDDQGVVGLLDLIVGGEDVSQAKPSPEGVLYAMHRLEVSPEEVVYIGDSTVDAETARAAGVAFIGVTNGVTTAEELSRYPHLRIIGALAELADDDNPPAPPVGKPEKKRIGTFSLILLSLLFLLAISELVTTHSCLFLFILLLVWIMNRNRRIFPSRWTSAVRRWCKPAIVRLRALHIRQIRGALTPPCVSETTVCKNCGTTYAGNFCNRCGQSRDTPRFRLRNAVKNALGGLSNIDTGFGHTLVELLYRPGYMINDFLAGKRVPYFRPFQTLFVLAAIYILAVQLIDPAALKRTKEKATNMQTEQFVAARNVLQQQLDTVQDVQKQKALSQIINRLDRNLKTGVKKNMSLDEALEEELAKAENSPVHDFVRTRKEVTEHVRQRLHSIPFLQKVYHLLESWSHGNKAVSIICTLPLFALATRMAFRKPKFTPKYNLTEQMFVQTYIACQILLISILILPFNGKAAVNDLYDIPGWAIFLLFAWDYRQLFRCNWRESLWRTLLMFFYSLVIILLGAMLVIALYIGGLYLLKAIGV